jgi:hypothetical protein
MFKNYYSLYLGLCLLLQFQPNCACNACTTCFRSRTNTSLQCRTIGKRGGENYAPYFQKHSEQVIKDYTGHQTLTEQDQVAAQKLSKIFVNTVEVFLQQAKPIEIIQNIYTKQLSEEEVQAYIRFLKSPEGQSINKKCRLFCNRPSSKLTKLLKNSLKIRNFNSR